MVMIGGDNMPPDRLFLHKIRKKRVMFWSYKLIYVTFYRATSSHFGLIFVHKEQISYTNQLGYEEKFK